MIFILLPAFNEEKSLPKLLPKIKRVMTDYGLEYTVILCDDGSTDATLQIANDFKHEMTLITFKHHINRGLGETMRDLYERASLLSKAGDVIIRMDCDDTHHPKYIPQMVSKVLAGSDVVIASRFAEGGGQLGLSAYRASISKLANLFMKIFFPITGLKEYSCGFRAYDAKIIQKAIQIYGNNFIQLKGLGFTCTLEKLVKLNLIGASFSEVPFILEYDRKLSESKMISSLTTFGYFSLVLLCYWPLTGWRSKSKRNSGN